MSRNRQIPRLRDMAFDVLAKQGLFRTEFESTPMRGIPIPLKEQKKNSPPFVEIPLDEQEDVISGLVVEIARERLLPRLLRAVVNDDRNTVEVMLNLNPELLLLSPHQNCVIESQYTWQKFCAEDALTMAVKLKQIKMIELLLSFHEDLEQTDEAVQAKNTALSAWKPYEIVNDEIIIPAEYDMLAESLIQIFREETFPKGVPDRNNIPWNIELSEPTEQAIVTLLNLLVPKKAVSLQQHIDVELLLLAVYRAYVKHFDSFNGNWEKLDAFSIRIIGLIQSALIPETGKIFCEGLDDIVTALNAGKERKISDRAANLKLLGGEDFYRISRGARIGSGFEFFCGIFGTGRPGHDRARRGWRNAPGGRRLGQAISSKDDKFSRNYATRAAIVSPTRANK